MEEIKWFQKDYPDLNLKLQQDDPELFEYMILECYRAVEGYGIKRANKTTSKGTKMLYIRFKDTEDLIRYEELFNDMVDKFNEKYGIKAS